MPLRRYCHFHICFFAITLPLAITPLIDAALERQMSEESAIRAAERYAERDDDAEIFVHAIASAVFITPSMMSADYFGATPPPAPLFADCADAPLIFLSFHFIISPFSFHISSFIFIFTLYPPRCR